MTYKDIVTAAETAATELGFPLIVGDVATQNFFMNKYSGVVFTLEVPGSISTTNGFTLSYVNYTVIIRCVAASYYMKDYNGQNEVHFETELHLRNMLSAMTCKLDIGQINITRLDSEYNTTKAGWAATFEIYTQA